MYLTGNESDRLLHDEELNLVGKKYIFQCVLFFYVQDVHNISEAENGKRREVKDHISKGYFKR